MPKRWVVLSLDGLATSAIGAFGSPWNETPAIDQMAAMGVVYDRVVAASDDSVDLLGTLWGQRSGEQSWVTTGGVTTGGVTTFKAPGRVELFLNAGPQAVELAKFAGKFGFDQCTLIESVPESLQDLLPSDEIESTAMAKLMLPVLERLSESSAMGSPDWSILWAHSDSLMRCWDAPRWLFPVEEDDDFEEPIDQLEWSLEDFGSPAESIDADFQGDQKPPPIFETLAVPFFAVSPDAHPDLITSWMQTYGCQVRLLDRLIAILLEAIESAGSDIGLALMGTSGMSLGQNGWIGHRAGPIRSPQIHLPVILFDGEGHGIRMPGLRSSNDVMSSLVSSLDGTSRVSPEQWAQDDAFQERVVQTQTLRAERVLTTHEWFYVREGDRSRLFLKPDDRDDMNDIADRCRDVVDSLATFEPRFDLGL